MVEWYVRMSFQRRGGGRKLFFAPNEAGGRKEVHPPKSGIENDKISLYDYFYDEVLPLARQYGMTLDEFWHGDMRLLEVAQKAYYRDKSYTAWVQGQYNSIGFGIVLSNAFAKKGSKKAEYPKWNDPFEKDKKLEIKKENVEYEFRKSQAEQNAWLSNMLKR